MASAGAVAFTDFQMQGRLWFRETKWLLVIGLSHLLLFSRRTRPYFDLPV